MPTIKVKGGLRLTKGWKKLSIMLDDGGKRLEAEVGRATLLNAKYVAKQIRKRIKSKVSPRPASLTVGIKGSTKTLVDRGDFFKAVTGTRQSWKRGFAGILRNIRSSDGTKLVNLGLLLHEGETIPVTPRMRALFARLAGAADAGTSAGLTGRAKELFDRNPKVHWRPLKPSTVAIVIPGRPFIKPVVEDNAVQAKVRENWEAAVGRAMSPAKA